jgi:hypothetical protein
VRGESASDQGRRCRGGEVCGNTHLIRPVVHLLPEGRRGKSHLPDPLGSRLRYQFAVKAAVEVVFAFAHQRVDLAVEEVVCARNDLVGDQDALLGFQLFDGATLSASPLMIRPEDGQGARNEKS